MAAVRKSPTEAVGTPSISDVLSDIKARVSGKRGWLEKVAKRVMDSVPERERTHGRASIRKWFKGAADDTLLPPPTPRYGKALVEALEEAGAWSGEFGKHKEAELASLNSYFNERKPMEFITQARYAAATLLERLYRPTVKERKRALGIVNAESPMSAAVNSVLIERLAEYVAHGGCYAIYCPCGDISDLDSPSSLAGLVEPWRDVFASVKEVAETLIPLARTEAAKINEDVDAVANRVRVVVPNVPKEHRLSLLRWLPPQPDSRARRWLFFVDSGTEQMPSTLDNQLNWTYGRHENAKQDPLTWVQLGNAVAMPFREGLNLPAAADPELPTKEIRTWRTYFRDVIGAWEKAGRTRFPDQLPSRDSAWRFLDLTNSSSF
jgi:hypothetical protein